MFFQEPVHQRHQDTEQEARHQVINPGETEMKNPVPHHLEHREHHRMHQRRNDKLLTHSCPDPYGPFSTNIRISMSFPK